jgi:hypothetical protein
MTEEEEKKLARLEKRLMDRNSEPERGGVNGS